MKKNLFKALMSFVLQMSVLFNAYTQPNQQEYVSFPSPNAGNLGVYGEIPVGHFTGVPNIDVPLHTINSGDISLPISMSYHVGSVKPNVHPSWVGLGWTLMAGGSITRKQNGTIDELKTSANSNLPNYEVGYYYRQNHVFQYSPQLDYFIPEYLLAGFNGFKYDPSPDEFHFNFLGYSGSFMLNEQFEWEVFSDDPIKIEFNPVTDMVKPDSLPNQLLNYKGAGTGQSYLNHYNYDNCNQYFFRFTLITPDGIRYTFGGKNAIEYNVSYYNGPTAFPVPVTWHLTKIEDVNGKLVKLKYDYEDFVCDLSRNRSYRKGYYETSGGNIQMTFLGLVGQYYEVDCTSAEGEANVLYNGIEKIQAQLILPSYLDVIEYEGGEVEFNNSISEELRFDENYLKFVNYMDQHPITGEPIKPINHSDNMIYFDHWNDLQWRKLDKISIKSLGQYKGFTFNYINTPDERLKLGSIQEEGRSSGTGAFYATKPAFEFTYNDLMLPDHYLSDDIDHWGYYNGWRAVNEFNFLWPNPDPTASMHGMNIEDWSKLYYQSRETQSYNYPGAPKNYNMAEVLEKIQYPTGGYCEFNFELNKYSQVVNESRSELEGIENWISGVNRPPCEMYPTIGSHWTPDEVTTDPQNLKYRFEMIKCSSDDYSNANSGDLVYIQLKDVTTGTIVSGKGYGSLQTTFKEEGKLVDLFPVVFYHPDHEYQLIGLTPDEIGTPFRPYYRLDIYKEIGDEALCGGLRIRSITKVSGDSPTQQTVYSYQKSIDNTLTSSGILGGKHRYFWNNYEAYNDVGDQYILDRFSSNSLFPSGINGEGSHIGYSQVTEEKLDVNGDVLGKAVYQFTNFDEDLWGETHMDESQIAVWDPRVHQYSPFTSIAFERGKLLEESHYNSNNHLVKRSRNRYERSNNDYINFLTLDHFRICGLDQFTAFEGKLNEIFTSPASWADYGITGAVTKKYKSHYQLIKTTEEEFFPNSASSTAFVVEKDFEYNEDNQLSKTIIHANNQSEATTTKYVGDYDTQGLPLSNPIVQMQQKNILFPIEQLSLYQFNNDEYVREGKLYEYSLFNGTPKLSRIWGTELAHPDLNFEASHFDNGNFVKSGNYTNNGISEHKSEVLAYDNYGKVLSHRDVNDKISSYAWLNKRTLPVHVETDDQGNQILVTYLSDQILDLPVAKIENCDVESFVFNGFEENVATSSGAWQNLPGINGSTSYLAGGRAGNCVKALSESSTPKVTFKPSTDYQNYQFYFSCWVKSQANQPGEIKVEYLNAANESSLGSELIPLSVETPDEWEYQRISFDLNKFRNDNGISANVDIKVRLSIINNSTGNLLIDEFKVFPVDAKLSSFTYDDRGALIATSDASDRFSFCSYDALNRLHYKADDNGNIREVYEYEYQADNGQKNFIKKYVIRTNDFSDIDDLQQLNSDDYAVSISYLDGLGKEIQAVSWEETTGKNDLVSFKEYDAIGRLVRSYFPYTRNHHEDYHPADKVIQNLSYVGGLNDDAYAYERITYQNNLSDQPSQLFNGGKEWNTTGGAIKLEFRTNYANEVRLFLNGQSGSYHDADSLKVEVMIDENWDTHLLYKDKLGRKVMEDHEGAKTYYSYDHFGRLAFIIPPKTFAHMEATGNYNCYHPDNKEGIYRYSFNDKGLLIRKYIPGAGLSKIYYNAIGQVIMTEDPKGQKTFSKYDSFGREIINGIYFGTALPSSNDGLFEIKSNNSEGYTTDLSFPQSQIEIHNISYYDDYDFNGDLNVQSIEEYTNPQDGIFASEADSRTIGMLTGNRTGLFNKKGDVVIDYQISSMFYDSLGNMIQAKLENQTHEIDINNMLYNYSGDVVKTKKMHRSNIEGNLVSKSILKEYVFDHRSRLIEEYISVDGMAPVKTVHNSYDKLNRLSSKRLGLGNNLDEYLQKLDFKYNIRGQLKSINNLGDCESVVIIDPTGGTVEGRFTDQNGEVGIKNVQNNLIFNDDLFSLQLSYHTNSKLNIQPKFDGTIAAVEWQEGCDQLIEAYAFDYDNRDQLIEGDYSIRNTDESYLSVPNYDVNNVQYDLNGNILQLERNGSQGNTIDLLDYQIGLDNRLQSIEETGDQNEGFISQNSFGQYHYDQNGNMNRDDHKAFTIIYNSLDLPAIIAFDSGDSIVNIYNTLGQKLEKWTKPAGASLNDWSKKYYFSEIEYLDGNIESIAFDDGRITPSAGSFQFEYSIKDHLGNSRVNFADLNHDNEITEDEVLQRNAYYPFGMEMSKPNQAIIGTENDYQYNGKEITQDFGLNWYDYQARWYDPAIARWHTIDPLAESFQNWSPYNYVLNKPVNLIDPDGMAPDQPDPNDPPLESASLVWLRSESLRKDYESSLGKGVVMEVVGKSTKKDRSQKTKETWEAGNDYTMDEGFVRFSNKDINKNATNTIVLGANVSVSSDNPSNANGSAGFSWDYGENPQFTAGNSIGLVDKKIGPAKGALSISNSATVDLLTGESSSSTTINGTIGLQYGKEGGPSIGVMTTKLSKNVKTGKFTPSTSIVSISTKAFGRQWSGAITAKLKTARKVIYTIEK